jgi:hypothetical protein
MAIFEGQIPFFLENFLGKPASALPKGAQWVMQFHADNGKIVPVEAIKKCIQYEPEPWDIEYAMNTVLEKTYHDSRGCLFCQAIQIPGESMIANPEGLQTNGFLRTFVGGGRDNYPSLQVVFLESNISFVDNVIRPWVVATSHLGLIAREGADNYRCKIVFYKLGIININESPIVTQKYTFIGACPINVSGEEYNYSPVTNPVNRVVNFTYHYYTTESVKESFRNTKIPIPLSTIKKGTNISQLVA